MIIRVLLLAGLACAALTVMRGRTTALSLLMGRSAALLAIGVGAIAVLAPDLVTFVANQVGVGRGTDLLVYVMAVVFLLTTLALYSRAAAARHTTVTLARRIAVLENRLLLLEESDQQAHTR